MKTKLLLFILLLSLCFNAYSQVNANRLIEGLVNYANESAGLNPTTSERSLQANSVKYAIFSNDQNFEDVRKDIHNIFNNPATYTDPATAERNASNLRQNNREEIVNIVTNSRSSGSVDLKSGNSVTIPFIGSVNFSKEVASLITGHTKSSYIFPPVDKESVLIYDKEFDTFAFKINEDIIANDLHGQKHVLKVDRYYTSNEQGRKKRKSYYFNLSYNDEKIQLKVIDKISKPSDPDYYSGSGSRDIGPFTVMWDYLRFEDSEIKWYMHYRQRILVYYRYNY